jgi:hypothetical protein
MSKGSGDRIIPVLSAYKWSSGRKVTPPKLTATSRSPMSFSSAATGIEAIGALKGELNQIELDVKRLITDMNRTIKESNDFIQQLKN